MLRVFFTIAFLFLPAFSAMACSCGGKATIHVSELIEEYDYILTGEVTDARDLNGEVPLPISAKYGIELDEALENWSPILWADVSIVESFKGPFEGQVRLNFNADRSNCSGDYIMKGRTENLYLYDVSENENENALVQSAGWCSVANSYAHNLDHIRAYIDEGEDALLLHRDCVTRLGSRKKFAEVGFDIQPDNMCFPHFEDFKAGKFYLGMFEIK